MKLINAFLGRITMYRLMVWFLSILLASAVGLSAVNLLNFTPSIIIAETAFLIVACYIFNKLIAGLFHVEPNTESFLITALILSLIVGPAGPIIHYIPLLVASFAAMASKYVFKWQQRHFFNPAAFGVIVMAVTTGFGSSWWVGNSILLPLVVIGGLLMAWKIRRLSMVAMFLASYLVLFTLFNLIHLPSNTGLQLLKTLLVNSPIVFFAFVMLVEPATSPLSQKHRFTYAIIVALLATLLQKYASDITYSLELSLIIGNILTRMVEPNPRYSMKLKEKRQLSPDIICFVFEATPKPVFTAGQFLEWTLPHPNSDDRSIRRWFTISSSPTEDEVLLTTRFAEKGSTFKTTLHSLKIGDTITASGVEGDFVLPDDKSRPLVFIAGGIGVTPFRSMVKYLLDSGEKRLITLFYAVNSEADLVYMDIFEQAVQTMDMKIIPIVSEPSASWKGHRGRLDKKIIKDEVPELGSPLFYVSGPEPMVEAVEKILRSIGVERNQIQQDFFPGYTNTLIAEQKKGE